MLGHEAPPGIEVVSPSAGDAGGGMTLCLDVRVLARRDRAVSRDLSEWVARQVWHAQAVLDSNTRGPVGRIALRHRARTLPWRVSTGRLPGLVLRRGGRTAWSNDPCEDAFPVSTALGELLTIGREPGWLPVFVVEQLDNDLDGWRPARAIALGRNDFPVTTSKAGSGPAVVMTALDENETVLVHELAHVLIDWPRVVNGGNEHVWDRSRVCAQTSGRVGELFTDAELRRVNAAVSQLATHVPGGPRAAPQAPVGALRG